MTERTSLVAIATVFLRLGATAFGGPAAHVAMMEKEVVGRRGWLTRDEFLDYLGATTLIPGPNSTELAIHIGRARAGWPGLVTAGVAFVLPAMLIVGGMAWAYVNYRALPQISGLLYGLKPVVIAIVVHALWRLGRIALKSLALVVLGTAAVLAVVAGVHELVVLAFAGLVMAVVHARSSGRGDDTAAFFMGAGFAGVGTISWAAGSIGAAAASTVSLWAIFLILAKTGAVLFGSGYVLYAFLRADFVERLGWLTEQQLSDAIAVGQMTPGPVFTTATFIGYLLAGPAGAGVATLGIFLPAFFFVSLSGPLIPRLRQSAAAGAMLDGVNVASLALMAVVSWQLGRATLVDPLTIALALLSGAALLRYGVNSLWLLLAGAAIGLMVQSRASILN